MTGCICWIVFVLLIRFRSVYLSIPQEEISTNIFKLRNHRPPPTIKTTDRLTTTQLTSPASKQTTLGTGIPSSTTDRFTVSDTGATSTGSQTNTRIVSSVLTKSTYLPTLTTVHIPKYNWSMAMLFNISINRTFEKELNDPTSKMYKHYENEFSVTLQNVFSALREFEGILINGFRNGSIKCAFYLQLNGVANLTTLEDEFNNCIDNLKMATVDGVNIDVDENAIKAEYLRVVNAQITGSNCDNCQVGYVCSFVYGVSSCRHICELVADVCSNRGGCLYDPLKNQPTCRCTDGAVLLENKCQYQQKDLSSSQDLAGTIAGSVVGSIVGLVVICLAIYWYRTKDSKDPLCTCSENKFCNDCTIEFNAEGSQEVTKN